MLARHGIPGAVWWAVANPPAWAIGWLVTTYVISSNVKEQFTNFGAERNDRLRAADLARPRPVAPEDGARSRAMNVERRRRRPPHPPAARVQPVLLPARATLRLPGHPAPADRGDPEPLPGGRGEPEAALVRLHAHGRPVRAARRPARAGARPRRPGRRADGDRGRRPRGRRAVPRACPLALPRSRRSRGPTTIPPRARRRARRPWSSSSRSTATSASRSASASATSSPERGPCSSAWRCSSRPRSTPWLAWPGIVDRPLPRRRLARVRRPLRGARLEARGHDRPDRLHRLVALAGRRRARAARRLSQLTRPPARRPACSA